MKAITYRDEEVVIKKGIDLLVKGLGPLDAMRFMNIPRERKIDGVKRHSAWQKQLDKDKFFDKVFSGRTS